MVTAFCMARLLEFWIVGPSARGSVNGIPSSMISVLHQSLGKKKHFGLLTSSSSLQSKTDVRSFLNGGETTGDVSNQSSPPLLLTPSESFLDRLHAGQKLVSALIDAKAAASSKRNISPQYKGLIAGCTEIVSE